MELNKKIINFNSLNSYLAMFPLSVPIDFIEKYTKPNDLVMDNFSGRGTTLFACRLLNRNFVGNDLNPYAYVISKAKSVNVSKEKLLKRITQLELEFNKINSDEYQKIEEDFEYIYHPKTYQELLFFKSKLGINYLNLNDVDITIISYLFSIMQGKSKKDKTSAYLSVDMVNTISMTPNYIKKYVKENNLEIRYYNTFDLLRDRIKNRYIDFEYKPQLKLEYHNSLNNLSFVKRESVAFVFTSPPYLNMVNYASSNWIRLWLLGYQRQNLKNEIILDDKHNFTNYCNFIMEYLENIYPKLKNDAIVCLVIGDAKGKKLAIDTWKKIKDNVPYQLVKIHTQEINDNKKVLKILDRKSGSTKIDRILILKKI
ncbi:DNA methyltransferase [Mycoplasma buteonis]|uniref:DNA methyltransferase n=1 Tax=Mycoplasma buteonis TaxID=171280 RepID=UPI00068C6F59|nr:DNA methyltransferase [Mycoplasma buteonis]